MTEETIEKRVRDPKSDLYISKSYIECKKIGSSHAIIELKHGILLLKASNTALYISTCDTPISVEKSYDGG